MNAVLKQTFTSLLTSSTGRLLMGPLLVALAVTPLRAQTTTIEVGDEFLFPETAEVITATPAQGTFPETSSITIEQTFQVTTSLDLLSLFFEYVNVTTETLTVPLQIFKVSDYFLNPLPETPDPGDFVLNTSFMAPPSSGQAVIRVSLDNAVTLAANTGNEGYAVRVVNTDFDWVRTAGAGDTYAFGQAYENSIWKSNGTRELVLALSSQGPPPPLIDAFSVQSGDLNAGTTWSTGAAPAPEFLYNIVDSHTVTATSASFAGGGVRVQSGGTLDLAVSAANISSIEVQPGSTLTSSATGDFAVGDINATKPNQLILNETANFAASAGADFFLDVQLTGDGDLNFESNGGGSDMFIFSASGHAGVIRFNGSGDEVVLAEGDRFATLEMNSTGANRIVYDPTAQLTGGTLTFNQPGEIDHAASAVRLQGPELLVANAPVTANLTRTFSGNERRLFMSNGLEGAADITVNGTATDPTSGSTTHNEFEVGSTGEPGTLAVDTYSGTLTMNDFVDFEVRHSLPDARVVINNNARLEMGHQAISSAHSVAIGEVQVNSGGTLEVGYEADDAHNAYQFRLTASGSRSGSLTLADGTTTRMQVNGTAGNEYDSIVAEGNVTLNGTLEVLVNPDGSGGTNPVYAPTLGDTFDIVAIVAVPLSADFDNSGTVDDADLVIWETAFAADATADANGDGSSDGLDFLAWQQQYGQTSALTGTITGDFDAVVVNDPGGVMATAGLGFAVNVTSTLVQLQVVAAAVPSVASVPEPHTLVLLLGAAVGLANRGRRRHGWN
jgi:hypothetical protein